MISWAARDNGRYTGPNCEPNMGRDKQAESGGEGEWERDEETDAERGLGFVLGGWDRVGVDLPDRLDPDPE